MAQRSEAFALVYSVVVLYAFVLSAGYASAEKTHGPSDKPFAEHRVVLQLSDADLGKQKAVLNVANNLIRHYSSPELVDIEVVTFGPGVELLFAGNSNAARISSLVESGVRFYVCENTLASLARSGTIPSLLEAANRVPAGVPHIVERVGAGFILVRP